MRVDDLTILDQLTLPTVEQLLDEHTRERIPITRWTAFSWSISRHHTFSTCKRKYYLTYYGARRVREANKKIVSAVWWLKQVTSMAGWVGTVLHETAAHALHAHIEGETRSEAALQEFARARFRAGVVASQRGKRLDRRWLILLEHIYPEPLLNLAAVEGRIAELVTNFVTGECYTSLVALPPEAFLEVDEPFQSFQLADIPPLGSVKAFAIPDVLVDDDDRMRVIDWKTDDVTNETIIQQAAVYRLYVSEVYDAEHIEVVIGDLPNGGEWVAPPGQVPTTTETRQFIEGSIAAMVDHMEDVTYNTASIRDFPMTDDLSVCRGCAFKRVCWRHHA